MTSDEIRLALETAVGVPEQALHDAVRNATALAPAVIAVAQRMIGGRLPLPHEDKLLRFGLHALAAARETSACPAFLGLLRLPTLELDWLFSDERAAVVTRLLLSLFDGDVAAVCAIAADAEVDDDVRCGLLPALARLVWEGRASRERLLELLDRLDREALAPVDSFIWNSWQDAIMLLGLTDWIERVQSGWDAGRLAAGFIDVDREDWLDRTRKAAAQPDDPARFESEHVMPVGDPVVSVEWSADPPSGPGETPSDDEFAWLDIAMLRSVAAKNLCLEQADGWLTALAAGPVRVPAAEYLTEILQAEGESAGFNSPEHKTLVVDLLTRHHDSIERALTAGKAPRPWIYGIDGDYRGALWARGYLNGVGLHNRAWGPLIRDRRLADLLIAPLIALQPDPEHDAKSLLSRERRFELIRVLPELALATKAYWEDRWHPLLEPPAQRAAKVGRNEPCPCGSGKRYKRCCGALA